MAIKIPSKNIYEMKNQKIRNNVIDNVSVEQTIVSPSNEFEVSIYNEQITIDIAKLISQDSIDENFDIKSYSLTAQGTTVASVTSAYVLYDAKKNYYIEVYIKKTSNNKYISSLLLGVDKDENPNIKHSIYGTLEKGTAQTTIDLTWSSNKASGSVDKSKISRTMTSVSNGGLLSIPKELEKESEKIVNTEKAFAKTELTDTSTTKNTTTYSNATIDGEEYYKITFYIMSSIRTTSLSGGASLGYKPSTLTLSGEYEKYTPTYLEVTIYGNRIGIDLANGSITYGSGKNPYSLSGNELLQESASVNDYVDIELLGIYGYENNMVRLSMSSDYEFYVGETLTYKNESAIIVAIYYVEEEKYYLLEVVEGGEFYNKRNSTISVITNANIEKTLLTKHLSDNVLSQYSQGKETATLLCSISEYYDENGIIALSTKKQELNPSIVNVKYENGKYIASLESPLPYDIEITYFVASDDTTLLQDTITIGKTTLEFYYPITITKVFANPNMCFKNGDEVIPYVYGANGEEKPMSKYKNSEPKVFEVVGTNIIYDGAVWQELTLLEKNQQNT